MGFFTLCVAGKPGQAFRIGGRAHCRAPYSLSRYTPAASLGHQQLCYRSSSAIALPSSSLVCRPPALNHDPHPASGLIVFQ